MRVSSRTRCQCLQQALDPIDALGAGPSRTDPGGSLGEEWKAAELGLSPAAMSLPSTFHFTSGNGLLPTDLLLVTFSGPPSEMKEEMKDLRSRVEALEQVSFQHTPLSCPHSPVTARGCSQPAPTLGCLQPGFPSAPALFLMSCWPHAAAIPAVLHAAGSTHTAALPAQRPFECNQSPASRLARGPGGVHPGRQHALSHRVILLAGEDTLTALLLPAETPVGAGPLPQPHAICAGGCRRRPHQPALPLPPATGQNRLPERADLLP